MQRNGKTYRTRRLSAMESVGTRSGGESIAGQTRQQVKWQVEAVRVFTDDGCFVEYQQPATGVHQVFQRRL